MINDSVVIIWGFQFDFPLEKKQNIDIGLISSAGAKLFSIYVQVVLPYQHTV